MLTDKGTKMVRDGMVNIYITKAVAANSLLSTPHETSTRDDNRTIAALCIWSGTFAMADFFILFLTLRYLAGRGGEVGRMPRSSVKLQSVPEWDDPNEKVHRTWLWRVKTKEPQELSIFCHKNDLLLDWPFAFGCSMVMSNNPNEFMLPTFAAIAHDDDESDEGLTPGKIEKKRNERVTSHFNGAVKMMVRLCDELGLPIESSEEELRLSVIQEEQGEEAGPQADTAMAEGGQETKVAEAGDEERSEQSERSEAASAMSRARSESRAGDSGV